MPSKTTTPVLIRLEHALLERMDALAEAWHYSSRSELAREALKLGLDALESTLEGLTPELANPVEETPVEPALKSFAYWVSESARRCQDRMETRVPLNSLWRAYKPLAAKGMTESSFRTRLKEAQRVGLLKVTGDDLVLPT